MGKRRWELIDESGASGILMTLLIANIVVGGFTAFSTLHQSRAKGVTSAFKKLVARQTAKSSFLIMEAALKRRLWEMPPDSRCLKKTEFYVTGTTPDGASYRVDASFDVETNTLSMTSSAQYLNTTASSEKKIKVLDTSDFLVFSKATTPTVLARRYDPKSPLGFIGKKRKIYFEGPVQFYGVLYRPNPPNWSSPTLMGFPGELGTIFQGERMYFLGGLSYHLMGAPTPNVTDSMYPMLSPYPNRYGQAGGGAAYFTSNYDMATQLEQAVRSGSVAGLSASKAEYKKGTYPIALFCGAPPLNPNAAVDDGCYYGDPDKWFIASYGYSVWGHTVDFTCLADPGTSPFKSCSDSNQYPRGFDQWRRTAALDGIVYGSDGVPINYPPINWDNIEALKEDAEACGWVADGTLNDYQDCDLSNSRIVNDYVAGKNSCETISRLDLDDVSSKLKNFNTDLYKDANLEKFLLRRVVYSNKPLELKQSAKSGIFSSIKDSKVRENLSLWMVNEDRFILKPHQPDTTSPLDVNPAVRRQLYFNKDPDGALRPINLTLLSPDMAQVISPQHVPHTFVEMELALPVVGGRIKPKNHIFTDSFHQEDDGFKYGYRDVNIGDLTFISNAYSNSGFYLRGLWSGLDGSAEQYIRNACMFSDPVTQVPVNSEPAPSDIAGFPWIPNAMPAAVDSVVPPKGSRFYTKDGKVANIMYPAVLITQLASGGWAAQHSRIFHKGVKVFMNFDSTTPTGKRNLASPNYLPSDWYNADMSDRRYSWSGPWYPPTAGSSCLPPTTVDGGVHWFANYIALNHGAPLYLQEAPETVNIRLGSLTGMELPIVEISR